MDFTDYVDVVKAANISVKLMDNTNIPVVTDSISRSRLATLAKTGERPYLSEARLIQVRRSSTSLHEELFQRRADAPSWDAYVCTTRFDPAAPLPLSGTSVSDEVAQMVAQVVSRQPAEREISGSIPDASRPSVCRPRLRPPGAGIGFRAAVAWMRRRSPPVNGHPWPVGGKNE